MYRSRRNYNVTMCDKTRNTHRHKINVKPDLIASVGVNPSQVIVTGTTPLPPPPPTDNVRINFNNVYVNQSICDCAPLPFDVTRSSYLVMDKGVFEFNVNVNLFLLILGVPAVAPAPPIPIQLTNLVRYTLSVWAIKPTGQNVQLASKNGLFSRTESLPLENNGRFYAINDVEPNSLTFMINTDERNPRHVSVGDYIYVTLKISTPPVGNFSSYTISVTSAGQGEDQSISASFFNIKRISD